MVKKSFYPTACLAALISGGMGVLAYSPFDYWFVAFLSAAGLIWAATLPHKKTALWATLLWSVSYFAIGVNWVQISMIQFGGVPEMVSYIAVLLLALYLSIYPLLFAYVSQRFSIQNPWVLASVFTFTEYLREVVFTGFPWLQFGYSQIDGPFYGIAPILGVEGVTFFVMVTSGYLVQGIRRFAKKTGNLTACAVRLIVVLAVAFGAQWVNFVDVDDEKAPISVGLVQGNIAQQMKWDPAHFETTIKTYDHLVTSLMGKNDVIILPESAIPALENEIEPLLQRWQHLGQESGSQLIVGSLYQGEQGLFNSAVVLANGAQPYSLHQALRYNKYHLVPFGEYVPFGNVLDWMREVFVLPINLSQGEYIQQSLIAKERRFNMAICYEIIYADQVQQNQKAHNADYLLTISNDAWFGASIGPWQHFQMARMRALELGRPLIRATNTGVTAFVDAKGKVVAQLPQFNTATLTHSLQSMKGNTLFGEFGRWLIYGICWIILVLSGGIYLLRR